MATATSMECWSESCAAYPSHWSGMQSVYERLVTAQSKIEAFLTQDLRDAESKARALELNVANLRKDSDQYYQMYLEASDERSALKRQLKPKKRR